MDSHNQNSIKKQQGSERDGGRSGGYVPIYHDVEEIIYGPDSPLDRLSKVLLCIRHKTLRDADERKYISKEFIMEKTGLDKDEVKRALRKLEDKEMILIHRSKTGKVWNTSEYQLHPKRFGKLFNWYKNNPKLTVIKGGKDSYVGDNHPLGVGDNHPLGVGDNHPLQNELKFAELLDKIRSNNPCIKNPDTKTQKNDEIFFQKRSKGTGANTLQVEWLRATDGKVEFDEWRKVVGR